MNKQAAEAFEILSESFLKIVKINLSTEEIEIIKASDDDFCEKCKRGKKTINCLSCFADSNRIHVTDKENYLKHTNIDYLREFFKTHNDAWRLRYRRKSGNTYMWVMMEIVKAKNYSDKNQIVIISVQDVDKDLSNIFEHEQKLLNSLKTERMCMAIVHDLISSGVWKIEYDEKGKGDVFWSDEFRRMIGYKDETDFPNVLESWLDLIHPLDIEMVKREFFGTLNDKSGKRIYDAQYRLLTKDRGYRWFRDAGEVSRRPDGSPFIYLGIFIDITESKEKELLDNEIKRKNHIEQKQLNLIKSLSSIYYTLHVIDLDSDTVTEFATSDFLSSYINSTENISQQLKTAIENAVSPRYLAKALSFSDLSTLRARLGEKNFISEEIVALNIGWIEASFIVAERDEDGKVASVIFATRSIDKEKRREENLLLLSNTDELTGLFNRHAYDDDTAKLSQSSLGENFAIISLDVNGLKRVNDEMGHAAGDIMLKAAAERISRHFSHVGKCYRMGGDEFAVITTKVSSQEMTNIYNDFVQDLAAFKTDKIKELAVSFGCAFSFDYPDLDVSELAKVADKKMYQDKSAYYIKSGKDRRRR